MNRIFKKIARLLLVAAALLFSASTVSAAERLTAKWQEIVSAGNPFKVGAEWFPFPEYGDRAGWEALLGASKDELVRKGEKLLKYKWQNVPASSYLEFERSGDRGVMQRPLAANRSALNNLALAELAEGKGRFLDQIINGAWYFAHIPSWVASAHTVRQQSKRSLPDDDDVIIDLYSGSIGANLSLVLHFFEKEFDKVDPSIGRSIRNSIERNILKPYLDETKHLSNWWLGFKLKENATVNNWNPWCNSNCLLAFLLVEKDQATLDRAVEQSARSVDKYYDYIKSDGACEEGPSYWGHAVGEFCDWLLTMNAASTGRFDVSDDPQISRMGRFVQYSYIGDGWINNFADGSARTAIPARRLYRLGKMIGDGDITSFAVRHARIGKGVIEDSALYQTLLNLKSEKEMEEDSKAQPAEPQCPNAIWYPETEIAYFRNGNGWFLGAKGGHNNESHNHNDIGTITLYIDSIPVLVDAGVGTYTRQTFSKERYSIWTMQSDWHNLPSINGASEVYGKDRKATKVNCDSARKRLSMDISEAFLKDSAKLNYLSREISLGEKSLSICDSYSISRRNNPDVERFLTAGRVLLPGENWQGREIRKGELVLVCKSTDQKKSVAVMMTYPATLKASVETKEFKDGNLTRVWGDRLYRISLTSSPDAPLKGKYSIRVTKL